ncbi:hypothetical protein [Reyranella sp.]|uniref:hypothetical protein n=1 Tax=Reyranella sp. TaxID=1929291 RepID=UPI0025E2428B|nr:hypothetical protein [Reyranella sp.]
MSRLAWNTIGLCAIRLRNDPDGTSRIAGNRLVRVVLVSASAPIFAGTETGFPRRTDWPTFARTVQQADCGEALKIILS